MPMKKYKPEQIVNLLRQIEVAIANGKPPATLQGSPTTAQTYYRRVNQPLHIGEFHHLTSALERILTHQAQLTATPQI
ncbi:MAG TPA: hypothetical protein VMJ93_07325 [Verrucomicrobiae bacterium]|nr:hypothetical protein [Verrucomicrobiae bacterium]